MAKNKRGMAAKHFGPGNPPPEGWNLKSEGKYNATQHKVKDMKPMLAETCKSIDKVKYPVFATPKIDGIRCLTVVGGSPVSRSLKPIPNNHIRESLEAWGMEGLDGELWIKGAKTFGEVSGAVMRVDGTPDFEYLVFDCWDRHDVSYQNRMRLMDIRLAKPRPAWVTPLKPVKCVNAGGLMKYWSKCIDQGFEGAIFRDPDGPYKYGRSTRGMMSKLKVFADDEAEIVGFAEQMHNANPAKKNALGRTERSSAKEGKVPTGKLGKFLCKDLKTGIEFEVGTGFTDKQRKEFWRDRSVYIGFILCYRHQPSGAKAKPRFPSFKGFRHLDDMS